MATTRSCIFCDIVRGAAEVSVCYEDVEALAFMDIQPVNPGHVLIVPRRHYESLDDIPLAVSMHLFRIAMKLGPTIKKVVGAKGTNIVVNSGSAAGQDVFHYHVHVIPRREGDGFDVPLPFEGSAMPGREALDMVAARIHSELHDPLRFSSTTLGAGAAKTKARR